jgi:hypothetical protein
MTDHDNPLSLPAIEVNPEIVEAVDTGDVDLVVLKAMNFLRNRARARARTPPPR